MTPKPSADELRRLAGLYVNPITGNMAYVSLKDADLIVGRTTGPVLVPIGPNRFWFPPQSAEWEFKPNGELVTRFVTASPPRRPVTVVRREPSRPSRDALARYAGTYFSPELGATYTVSVADTALALRTGTNKPQTVAPAYGDVFTGFALIEFMRDASGAVNGFTVSTGRVRKVRFERTR